MNRIVILMAITLIVMVDSFAQSRTPVVTPVQAVPRTCARYVDLTYNISDQVRVVANDKKGGGQVINDGYGDYVYVPAGEFKMGDNFNEGFSFEKPVHKVSLNAYYIGKYEVTNAEYKKFIDDGGYTTKSYWTAGGYGQYGSQPNYWTNPSSSNENFPVIGVSWFEAMAYCKWLSAKTGKIYRLPTEAEWEKAARGDDAKNSTLGHQRRYPWGDTIDGSYVNYYGSGDPYDNGLTPVGYYDGSAHSGFVTHNNASPYGAYDMVGNVYEWCYDWYKDTYYSNSPSNNPHGPSKGIFRVIRGGGWYTLMHYLRSATRNTRDDPTNRDYNIGFRCLREP